MKSGFASANLTVGEINEIIEKMGGREGALRFLRGETSIVETEKQDSIIYFSVTSDGTTGEEWIELLESSISRLSDCAKRILLSEDFSPTSGVTTKIAVLKGELFSNNERITKNIREEAEKRRFSKPNIEVACLIRAMFSSDKIKAMGLCWIITMHEPVRNSDGDPLLLCAGHNGGPPWLDARYAGLVTQWGDDDGFAFVVL